MTDTEQPRGSAFASLRNHNYRRYFTAQVISMIGSWMQLIALPWLIYEQTHSGTAVGLIAAAESLPVFLFASYGGVIVDRVTARRCAIVTQSTQGCFALALGILTLTNTIQIWMIVVFAIGLGTAAAFDGPARSAIVMELVGKDELRNAISLNQVMINTARAAGPAAAAIIIAKFGVGDCFIYNAISFGAVVIALCTFDRSTLIPVEPQPRTKGQLRAGLAYIAHTPEVRTPLVMMALVGTFGYEYPVSLLLLAKHTFHGGAGTYSMLTTALGSGAVASGFWVAARGRTGFKWCAIAMAEYTVTTALAAFAPTLPVALVALFCWGLGYVMFNALGNSSLQLACDPEMRGRALGLWYSFFGGSTVIGGPIVGLIGDDIGARWSLAIGACAALVATGVSAMSMRTVAEVRRREHTSQATALEPSTT